VVVFEQGKNSSRQGDWPLVFCSGIASHPFPFSKSPRIIRDSAVDLSLIRCMSL
jgi:hypothetical protein